MKAHASCCKKMHLANHGSRNMEFTEDVPVLDDAYETQVMLPGDSADDVLCEDVGSLCLCVTIGKLKQLPLMFVMKC